MMTRLAINDTTKHAGAIITLKPYAGPVPGVTSEYISVSTDNLMLTALGPNVFLQSGAGNDVLTALGGRNVLDGGSGSNTLIGGTGTDTFYLDAQGKAFTLDTIVNFHKGDDLTIWGWLPGVSRATWVADHGPAGYTGATLQIDIDGKGAITDRLTFAGYSVAQAKQFQEGAASVAGHSYLHITA
jgi:serralysin